MMGDNHHFNEQRQNKIIVPESATTTPAAVSPPIRRVHRHNDKVDVAVDRERKAMIRGVSPLTFDAASPANGYQDPQGHQTTGHIPRLDQTATKALPTVAQHQLGERVRRLSPTLHYGTMGRMITGTTGNASAQNSLVGGPNMADVKSLQQNQSFLPDPASLPESAFRPLLGSHLPRRDDSMQTVHLPSGQKVGINGPDYQSQAASIAPPIGNVVYSNTISDPDFRRLLAGSTLVLMEDRSLVTDALLLSMSQMGPCKVVDENGTPAVSFDRTGGGKVGLACRYCRENFVFSISANFDSSVSMSKSRIGGTYVAKAKFRDCKPW